MRVLHIISSGGMYGAEAVILNMSRTLNESGHSSVLGIFSNSDNPNLQLHEIAQQEGIESYLIPCEGRIDTVVSSRIRELAVRIKADVVHAHGYKADIYVYFALRCTAIPFVSTCHTWYDNDLQLRLYGIADRLVLKRFAAVISVSDDVTLRLRKAGVDRKSITMIANGIDLRPFDRAEPGLRLEFGLTNELVVGLIGRLAHEKGVDVFIRAAAKVLCELPDTRFFIVGDGPDREGLESLIAELNIYDRVTLTGRRSDMPAVYASLDLMVSSSRQEGLPIAILEGMATGLAIVATKVGQVPTVVVDDETGLLIAPEDVDALATAMTMLLKDASPRERYGNAARGKIEREFSAARMTEDYLAVYEAVCTRKREAA